MAMAYPGQARTVSVVKEKTKKPTKVASAVSGSSKSQPGPEEIDSNREAWADALSMMGRVNTPDPWTALAKVAGMGLAGYGQGKAARDKDRLARALAGEDEPSLSMSATDEAALNLSEEIPDYDGVEVAINEPAEAPRKKGRYEDKPYPKSWVKTDPRVKAGKNKIPIGRYPAAEPALGPEYAPYPEEEADALNDPYSDEINRAIAEAEASGQFPANRNHPLLGQTIGPQDHMMLDHELDGMVGNVIKNRARPDEQGYTNEDGTPYTGPLPGSPEWYSGEELVPGTDDYYQRQTGEPIDLSPAGQIQTRRPPGRFGGAVPLFDQEGERGFQRNGFQRTAAEGEAKPATKEEEWKRTESMRRDHMLTKQVFAELPTIMKSFEVLGHFRNEIGNANPFPSWTGLGNPAKYWMTPEGKITRNAVSNLVNNYLVLTSGATVTQNEVERRTDQLIPAFNDEDEVIADKKMRIMTMIREMANITNLTDEYERLTTKRRRFNPQTGKVE
jgi:hypothetical protein